MSGGVAFLAGRVCSAVDSSEPAYPSVHHGTMCVVFVLGTCMGALQPV